jgi:hypothetical protein
VWYSLYQCARVTELLGEDCAQVQASHLRAHEARPSRAEPLVALATYHRGRAEWNSAYLFARGAAEIALSSDRLFVDVTAHTWRSRDELALALFYTGRPAQAGELWRKLLDDPALPAEQRARIEKNLSFVPA